MPGVRRTIRPYPVQLGMDEDMSAFRSISMINHIEGMDGLVQVLGKLFT